MKKVTLPTGRRPGGRRAKRAPKPGERVTLSVRIQPELKRAIDDAAAARGWSQGHEVEYRLKHTTDREGLLLEALTLRHGPVVAVILMALSDGVRNIAQYGASIARREQQPWSIDAWSDAPHPFESAAATIAAILHDLHPLRRGNIPEADEHHRYGQDDEDGALLGATTWPEAIRRSADLATMSATLAWAYLHNARREYLQKARREHRNEEKVS